VSIYNKWIVICGVFCGIYIISQSTCCMVSIYNKWIVICGVFCCIYIIPQSTCCKVTVAYSVVYTLYLQKIMNRYSTVTVTILYFHHKTIASKTFNCYQWFFIRFCDKSTWTTSFHLTNTLKGLFGYKKSKRQKCRAKTCYELCYPKF
jgi:hypothetical protein